MTDGYQEDSLASPRPSPQLPTEESPVETEDAPRDGEAESEAERKTEPTPAPTHTPTPTPTPTPVPAPEAAPAPEPGRGREREAESEAEARAKSPEACPPVVKFKALMVKKDLYKKVSPENRGA